MTPLGSAAIGTAWFLNGLSNLQQEETQTQIDLSSGYQINDAADSPSQTPELIQLSSTLAAVQDYQTNLSNVQTEATAADDALGSGSLATCDGSRDIYEECSELQSISTAHRRVF